MFRLTLLLTLIWVPSFILDFENLSDLFTLRKHLFIYTGMLCLGYISMATVLSARWRWVEKIVGGLDKGYRLHKQLGIGAAIAMLMHWLLIIGGNAMIERGLMSPPPMMPGEPPMFIKLAVAFGEYSLYAVGTIVLIALIQGVSYKRFQWIHKWSGVIVIMGVLHALVFAFLNFGDGKLNVVLFSLIVVMVLLSIVVALMSIFGLIGRGNKSHEVVTNVQRFQNAKGADVIRFSIQLESNINYKEGQFAYLNFKDEAPHPFSILNYNQKTKMIEFGVKNLGDYTHKLVNTLIENQTVIVEGGYGHFQVSEIKRQVWVGAGIGIIPMLSRLHALKGKNADHTIDLFYCVSSEQEAYFASDLKLLANETNVKLHILAADKQQYLTPEWIAQLTESQDYEVSFCGPYTFGESLKSGLAQTGFNPKQFKTELFKMR
ncbi:ferric reductase-like transmembrane domain-containing protein [Vibrio campbellii]